MFALGERFHQRKHWRMSVGPPLELSLDLDSTTTLSLDSQQLRIDEQEPRHQLSQSLAPRTQKKDLGERLVHSLANSEESLLGLVDHWRKDHKN